jgi:hypothetical protein
MKHSELKQIIREEIKNFQKPLLENEEFEDEFPNLDYDEVKAFIESKGYKIEDEYYEGGFDVDGGDYFVGVFEDHIAVTDEEGDIQEFPFPKTPTSKKSKSFDDDKFQQELLSLFEEYLNAYFEKEEDGTWWDTDSHERVEHPWYVVFRVGLLMEADLGDYSEAWVSKGMDLIEWLQRRYRYGENLMDKFKEIVDNR